MGRKYKKSVKGMKRELGRCLYEANAFMKAESLVGIRGDQFRILPPPPPLLAVYYKKYGRNPELPVAEIFPFTLKDSFYEETIRGKNWWRTEEDLEATPLSF